MPRQPGKLWLMMGLLVFLVGACITYSANQFGKSDRGIRADHARHAKEGLGCTDCHNFDKGEANFPTHEVCSTCHEIDKNLTPGKACEKCHAKEGYAVTAYAKRLTPEVKFAHPAHIAKGVECASCHADPDKGILPAKQPMAFCMDCHAKSGAKQTECQTCHSEVNKDTRPTMRGGVRLSHDAPAIWENVHGRESKVDPAYCALCHDTESYCEDCHRKNPPKDHTLAWRRDGHGLRASWNRDKCAVCHEEDMCVKCHRNTEPSSHKGGWGRPANLHCGQCHYPPATTSCVTCHEQITHATAMPSPHDLGVFPPRCGVCHPGGLPNRAPHVLNSTARCTVCH